MQRGFYISIGAHALLIGWLLFGGLLESDPPDMQVADVTILSEAEFAALVQTPSPDISNPNPQPLTAPPEPEPEPDRPAPQPDPEPAPRPDPAPAPQAPEPERVPDVPVPPEPAEVVDTSPVLPQPDPVPDAPIRPEPAPLPSTSAPQRSTRPKPRPAPRVAPTPVAPPDPDSVVDPDVQQAASPDAISPDRAEDAQEATAPEEASTEIVTEAEEPSGAVETSPRPQARPPRAAAPQPEQATPDEDPDPATPSADDILNAALAEALAGGEPDNTASGPPLTSGEKEGLKLAVEACWVVDVGSQAANVIVTVGFDMDRDGKVVASSMHMISAEGGEGSAVDAAFQSARRAVLRCQQGGYSLPAEKYDHWKKVEMTFDPSQMRLR